jgi:hypothetical protein
MRTFIAGLGPTISKVRHIRATAFGSLAWSRLQSDSVDIGNRHQQSHELLLVTEPEFLGLLDGVDLVSARIC